MKKVLIINTTFNKGGAARVAHDLFENINSDFEVFFAYGRGVKDSNPKTFYFGNKLEMFIHIFLVRFLGLEGYGTYFSTKKLINYIKQEKFDLINLHNLHGYYLNFFLLFKFLKESNIPVIYSLHDEWPITWLPAHSLGCAHCKTGLGKCTNTYAYPKNYFPLFLKYMLKKKQSAFSSLDQMSIVCPSVWLKEQVVKSYLNKFEVITIYNGVDTDIFKPVVDKNKLRLKYNLPLDKKIIIFSASNLNDSSKGINYIIDVAHELRDKNYLFVGLGAGEITNIHNIKTLGYIYDKQELSELYALSDLYCFASAAETFLLSAAESLACGVPVIGFDLPVVRELVTETVGILTKNNSEDLANSIISLLHNEDKLVAMGQAGRDLIENSYSKKIFFDSYLGLYNKFLS
jgi:glycosyltransferase involved in cell wall biosynthesis